MPNLASALGAFLFRQFFLSVPLELGGAARIDGASEWRIFWPVYRPLAQPMTAAFTIIAFLQNWNVLRVPPGTFLGTPWATHHLSRTHAAPPAPHRGAAQGMTSAPA